MSSCRSLSPVWSAVCGGALLALAALSGCSLEKPEAPTFETTIAIPAADEHYDTQQLVDSEGYLENDGTTGRPQFVVEGEFGPQSVATALDVSVNGLNYSATLSTISVADPPDLIARYPLSLLLGVTVPAGGGTAIIPAASITPARQALATIDEFDRATLSGGTLRITLLNHLPVALGGASPLVVRLYDVSNDALVLSAQTVEGLAAGGSVTLTVDLAGRGFSNRLAVEVEGSSPGSGNESVPVQTEDALEIRCALSGLGYASATLTPATQTISIEQDIALDAGVRLNEAAFLSGRLEARLSNTLPLPVMVTLTAAELNRDGAPLVEVRTVAAGTPANPTRLPVAIDLAGAALRSAGPEGSTSVRLRLEGRTNSSASTVTLSSTMGVAVDLDPATFTLDSVVGRFDGKTVDISPTTSPTDLPDDIESLRFEAATLTLDLENGAGLAASTDLTLRGQRAGQADVVLPLEGYRIAPAQDGQPVTTRITLTEANSALLGLVHLFPDRVTLSGRVALGDGATTGSVRRTDTVRGHFRLTAPLRFRFDELERVADSFDFTIGRKAQDAIRDHVTAAEIEVRLTNHFPLAVTAVLQFGADSTEAGAQPQVVLAPVTVGAAPVDAGGRVSESVVQTVTVTIPPDRIPFFARDRVWGTARLTLRPGVAGQTLEVESTDFVDVKALARFRYRVKS